MRSLLPSLLTVPAVLMLASCANNPFAKSPPPPETTQGWRQAVVDVPLPATRKDFAKKFPKVVPVKTGEAFATFSFSHSSEPQDYEFYILNHDARLMLQVGYKQKPVVVEDKRARAAANVSAAADLVTPAPDVPESIVAGVVADGTTAAAPDPSLDPLVITMDGVKRLKVTPLPEDSIVSAQIVLKKEIRFLGISTQSEVAAEKTEAAARKKKPARRK
ncbi:hypothetical protein DES53_102340 [Roseimicrobium gellanilyticum]|uniref:Lipoprotein n=1 Tax=Roseimicrobium gellanilyticum TaxID=748857 RepID=A0A366HR55_9BACT|nr:hypothetical protein [Roseimicrobium gellanilyticum]RBP45956.1 hypothetical protein DES53_102340 [Roseimicrobium gellanilyticum]